MDVNELQNKWQVKIYYVKQCEKNHIKKIYNICKKKIKTKSCFKELLVKFSDYCNKNKLSIRKQKMNYMWKVSMVKCVKKKMRFILIIFLKYV